MSAWFRQYRRCARPKARLFGFPYAGGSASVFDGWAKALPEHVDVFAVQAPGRANRFAEAPIADLQLKVSLLRNAISGFVDVPYVFVGHSNGALTAFELARSLQAAGNRNLLHLVLSAKRAPHLPRKTPILHQLPHDELVDELRAFSATPAAILEDRELLELFLPMLRADFALSEVGSISRRPRLRGSCTLFRGRADDKIEREDVLAWQEYVEERVSLREFEGDHFFIDNQRQEVVAAVGEILTSAIEGREAVGSTRGQQC